MADALDELYGAPLEEFVARRNALAKALRKDGKADEADAIAALRKPAAAAWVVNRLARDERPKVKALVTAASDVKKGKDGADARFRASADELTRAARTVLEEAGKQATDALVRDVATTIRSAATAEPELLTAGRLETVVEPSGFEAMAGATLRRHSAAKTSRPATGKKELAAARKAVDEARKEARKLRKQADEAANAAERAETASARAETALEKAETHLARLASGD